MRKDNELLILAKQGCSKAKKSDPCVGTTLQRSCCRDNEKGLTGAFRDYLTEVDVSSPCERLPDDYQEHLEKNLEQKLRPDKNLEQKLRPWWEKVDSDQEWIEKTERDLF